MKTAVIEEGIRVLDETRNVITLMLCCGAAAQAVLSRTCAKRVLFCGHAANAVVISP
jgi:hypothetical protein